MARKRLPASTSAVGLMPSFVTKLAPNSSIFSSLISTLSEDVLEPIFLLESLLRPFRCERAALLLPMSRRARQKLRCARNLKLGLQDISRKFLQYLESSAYEYCERELLCFWYRVLLWLYNCTSLRKSES